MFFRQLHTKEATLSYLFGCASCKVAVAVDPVLGDEEWFLAEAATQGVKITHVIDTHVHADHYSGGRALAKQCSGVYCLHESNTGRVHYPFQPIKNGERINVGNVYIDVLHTPGHTHDSLCLLVTDKRRGESPWFVLTGDTLFVGGVGRPDLAGAERDMAGQIFDSIRQSLLTLPDDVEIFPGHTSGSVCGAGLSGKPSSTIGFEKRFNKGLTISDRAAFVAHLTSEIPPRPAGMEQMVAFNLGHD